MEHNNLPPILEVEDTPLSTAQLQRPLISPSPSRSSCHSNEHPSSNTHEEQKNAFKQGDAYISPDIDEHTLFWSTYDKIAGAYDAELLDGWNKSLDILLIFAGLFSAINTAFIIESYKGLQPDPVETTNALLRLLLTHRNDNVILTTEELSPGNPNPFAVPINSIFFSSLSFSLTAAFGAVTAKQWLNEYSNYGSIKALHVQGQERQAKFKGLKTWHLRFIIELLPILLQFSLFLFFIGVIRLLWALERRVAVLQLVLSATGLAAYIATVIVGIVVPTSPFQTPLSKYLPRNLRRIWQHLGVTIPFPPILISERFRDAINIFPWKSTLMAASERTTSYLKFICQSLLRYLGLGDLRGLFPQEAPVLFPKPETTPEEIPKWSSRDISAAESVVWLLERAENPDVTITALDAIPRLPPDLLLCLIERREGLLERIYVFHNSLLPESLKRDLDWTRSWHGRSLVSGAAILHILKARSHDQSGSKPDTLIRSLRDFGEVERSDILWEDPVPATRAFLALGLSIVSGGFSGPLVTLIFALQTAEGSLGSSSQFNIKFASLNQPSVTSSLTASLSPLQLALDSIICYACRDFDNFDYLRPPSPLLTSIFDVLHSILQRKPSVDIISHIALATAAIQWLNWSVDRSDVWSYPSSHGRQQFKNILVSRLYAVDKGKMVLENIALTISLVDAVDFGPIPTIHCDLLAATEDLYHDTLKFTTTAYPNFSPSLLRLSRGAPDDMDLQARILRLLSWAHRWISPLIGEYKDDIYVLIKHTESPTFGKGYHNQIAFKTLLSRLVIHADDTVFAHIFVSPGGLLNGVVGMEWRPVDQPSFLTRVLQLHPSDTDHSPVLYGTQLSLSAKCLSQMADKLARFHYIDDFWVPVLQSFVDRVIDKDTEFQWPAYFTSAGIAISGHHHVVPDVKRIQAAGHRNEFHVIHAWIGECVLLLWRKAGKEIQRSRLPEDWSDDAFFEAKVVDGMLEYFKCVIEQGYTGIDRNSLRNYFRRAQKGSSDDTFELPQNPDSQATLQSIERVGIKRGIGRDTEANKVQRLLIGDDVGKEPDVGLEMEERQRKLGELLEELGPENLFSHNS